MRYPLTVLAFSIAACSPVTEKEIGLENAASEANFKQREEFIIAPPSLDHGAGLREPVWTTTQGEGSPSELPSLQAKPAGGTAHPLQFPALSPEERQALIAEATGPKRLHGYLFANTDSSAALEAHYSNMALEDLHRMHAGLEGLLPKIETDGLEHTVNDWPLDATAARSLQREKNWLSQRMVSQFEQNAETLLASSTRTDWKSGYHRLDPQQVNYEIWVNQRLMGHEQSTTGRAVFFN